MAKLSEIKTGKINLPPRLTIYGIEKIGKTTLATNAPDSILIQTESGSNEINCSRFPLATAYDNVTESLNVLKTENHSFRTVVIDSLDWLERLVFMKTCKENGVENIEEVGGGYGKGYFEALIYWRNILDSLDWLRNEKKMNIILIAHSKVEKVGDPEFAQEFDRHSIKLHKLSAPLIIEWSDAVLFATRKAITKTVDGGFNKSRTTIHPLGKDGGDRVLKCNGAPNFVAGNRYDLPAEINLNWDELSKYIAESQSS